MPLVAWIKVVGVDDVVAGSRLRFKNFISLVIVGLQKLLEVEVILASSRLLDQL